MAPQPGNFVIMFQLELSLIFEATVQFGRFKEAAGEMLHCETLDGQRIVLEKSAYNIDPIVSRHSRLDKTGDSPA
jgi:hypothetical protein